MDLSAWPTLFYLGSVVDPTGPSSFKSLMQTLTVGMVLLNKVSELKGSMQEMEMRGERERMGKGDEGRKRSEY